MTPGRSRFVDIWKVTVLRRFQSLVIRAGCIHLPPEAGGVFLLDVPKESFTAGQKTGRGRELFMALTFGTLLSSQGADAHLHNRFRRIRGNPRYFTRSVPRGQTRPALPGLPLGRGGSKSLVPRAWGNIRPAPLPVSPLGSPGSCGSVPRTRRTLARPEPGCKFTVRNALPPGFAGLERCRHRADKVTISGSTSVTWGTRGRQRPAVRRAGRPCACRTRARGRRGRRGRPRTASRARRSRRRAPHLRRRPVGPRWYSRRGRWRPAARAGEAGSPGA